MGHLAGFNFRRERVIGENILAEPRYRLLIPLGVVALAPDLQRGVIERFIKLMAFVARQLSIGLEILLHVLDVAFLVLELGCFVRRKLPVLDPLLDPVLLVRLSTI